MYNIMVSYTLSRGVDYCPLRELSPGTWGGLFFFHGAWCLSSDVADPVAGLEKFTEKEHHRF